LIVGVAHSKAQKIPLTFSVRLGGGSVTSSLLLFGSDSLFFFFTGFGAGGGCSCFNQSICAQKEKIKEKENLAREAEKHAFLASVAIAHHRKIILNDFSYFERYRASSEDNLKRL